MKETTLRKLAELLIEAKKDNDMNLMVRYANQLKPALKDAYFDPYLLRDPLLGTANRLVRKLQRADMLKTSKVKIFSGGLPSLGKRR